MGADRTPNFPTEQSMVLILLWTAVAVWNDDGVYLPIDAVVEFNLYYRLITTTTNISLGT